VVRNIKEFKMRPLKTDLSIYKKFGFEKPPVAVNYLFHKPEGIAQLDKSLGLCEMLKEAHQRNSPFYFTKENENCFGKKFLGMVESSPASDGGLQGVKLEIFREPQANIRIRKFISYLEKGTVNYVTFSPLEGLTLEPDLLMLAANSSQAEIVLRAMTYSTGEMFESKSTYVGGCSWLYVYPYISGKVNYTITGLAYGMKGRKVFPDGWLLISIPFQWIPAITQNLEEMKWVLPVHTLGREEFLQYEQEIKKKLEQESQNH
jgi:uncharacterized protein (DUF169 family)